MQLGLIWLIEALRGIDNADADTIYAVLFNQLRQDKLTSDKLQREIDTFKDIAKGFDDLKVQVQATKAKVEDALEKGVDPVDIELKTKADIIGAEQVEQDLLQKDPEKSFELANKIKAEKNLGYQADQVEDKLDMSLDLGGF